MGWVMFFSESESRHIKCDVLLEKPQLLPIRTDSGKRMDNWEISKRECSNNNSHIQTMRQDRGNLFQYVCWHDIRGRCSLQDLTDKQLLAFIALCIFNKPGIIQAQKRSDHPHCGQEIVRLLSKHGLDQRDLNIPEHDHRPQCFHHHRCFTIHHNLVSWMTNHRVNMDRDR